jgi:hypothetical protein
MLSKGASGGSLRPSAVDLDSLVVFGPQGNTKDGFAQAPKPLLVFKSEDCGVAACMTPEPVSFVRSFVLD